MRPFKWNRLLALVLAIALPLSCLMPAMAAETAAEKQEVIYVNLNADGSVSHACVVNIFDLEQAGKIVDYGDYTSVRNMTSTEALDYKGNTVTVNAPAGKLYYEGVLEQVDLPWRFDIEYLSAERQFIVLEELAALLPPLSEEQRCALETDILKNGCYAPVIVNRYGTYADWYEVSKGSHEHCRWSRYAFDRRMSWCTCFVGWCADQCGLIDTGTILKFECLGSSLGDSSWTPVPYSPQGLNLFRLRR